MAKPMPLCRSDSADRPASQTPANCPHCDAELALLRIITAQTGAEYWTMRCTRCGGIHLDIVEVPSPT